MRAIVDMDNIQIEITNVCHNKCSNCTRLIGHYPKTYFMSFEQFKEAVDSVKAYPKMTGVMGGEPLLHPEFEKFCEYLHSQIPPDRCGLWTCFPKGKDHYRELIVKTFGHIFLNDHTRGDILHGPIMVASEELPIADWYKWYLIDKCWIQNTWSASINPNGAFFCEVAAALSMLFNLGKGWEVNEDWWKKTPKDFVEQMETFCSMCGCAMPLKKRESIDGKDDVSPKMFAKLKELGSLKVKQGKCIVHDLSLCQDDRKVAVYKELKYRDEIAKRYGMFLVINKKGFQTPHLIKEWKPEEEKIQQEVAPNG